MKSLTITVLFLASQVLTAPPPPLISFGKGGEVGVNFGGYHASAGLGGLLNGGGTGGLHAEAGTPYGQGAKAGLGGSYGEKGSQGGLYASATAGGGTQAAAGLEGRSGVEGSAGHAYSNAQSGPHSAAAGLGGESSAAGSGGFAFSSRKSFNVGGGVGKELEVIPSVAENTVLPEKVNLVKHKKVVDYEGSVNYQAPVTVVKTVEVNPLPPVIVEKPVEVVPEAQIPVIYKEVRVHKHRLHKPRHHYKSWAGAGGYLEAGAGAQAPPATQVVYKEVPVPSIDKRIDAAQAASGASVGVQPVDVGYTKTVQVTHQRNPQFFADIFNIPIQTLSAVSKLLGNAASGTSVSVEKSGYAHADSHKYIGGGK